MKILMAASELAPFARTGTLADEVRELSTHLRAAGHDVTVVIPLYRVAREDKSLKIRKTRTKFSVQVGPSRLPCEIFEATSPGGVPVQFVARDEFFDRTGLYGADGRDYQDNSARFIFFTKCVVELARKLAPDVLHVHGWQTALAPVFARDQRLPAVTVLTPHSLEYQGNFWSYDFALTNLPDDYFSTRGVEFYGSMNCLKGGILFADSVVLPGRRYVAEMQTPEHGCGLENVLREHAFKLEGIPDGIDDSGWPAAPATGGEKSAARAALLKETGLNPGGVVFLADATATQSLGIDLLLAALDRLPSDDVRVLLLGSVPEKDVTALEIALRRHRGIFAVRSGVDAPLLALALAGADFLLLPGPLEPGGQLAILALRNGVVPIAAHCPGLRQFVRDFDPVTGLGNGYVFYRSDVAALADAIGRAMSAPAEVTAQLAATARTADFSWTASAKRHESLYLRMLRQTGRPIAA